MGVKVPFFVDADESLVWFQSFHVVPDHIMGEVVLDGVSVPSKIIVR